MIDKKEITIPKIKKYLVNWFGKNADMFSLKLDKFDHNTTIIRLNTPWLTKYPMEVNATYNNKNNCFIQRYGDIEPYQHTVTTTKTYYSKVNLEIKRMVLDSYYIKIMDFKHLIKYMKKLGYKFCSSNLGKAKKEQGSFIYFKDKMKYPIIMFNLKTRELNGFNYNGQHLSTDMEASKIIDFYYLHETKKPTKFNRSVDIAM